jgi:hypothetical protein
MATVKTYSISGDFPNAKADLEKLSREIIASAAISQASDYGHADISGDDCIITFTVNLTSGQVEALDAVVAAHDGETPHPKTCTEILHDAFSLMEPVIQMPRILNALDKWASFAFALTNDNYSVARGRLALALAAEDITQDDYNLIDSVIP